MHSAYLDAIRAFEGYAGQARWDVQQFSNGYGTRAAHPGEVIDRAEADRRFKSAVVNARAVVERQAPPDLDEGTKAALTSLTYNAGPGWVDDGLGDAVRRGNLAEIRAIFTQYNKAGGEVVAGLVSRRAAEAAWIGNPQAVAANAPAAASVGRSAPQQVASLARTLAAHDFAANAGAAAAPSRSANGASLPFASGLLAAIDEPGTGPAAVTPLTLSSVSEIARLMQLEAGRHLVERAEERAPADRSGTEKA